MICNVKLIEQSYSEQYTENLVFDVEIDINDGS